MSGGDRVPPWLRKVLDADVKLTKNTVDLALRLYPAIGNQTSHSVMKGLEWSCHGIPWLAFAFIFMYMSAGYRELQANLLIGLFLDIIVVALIKAVTRRQRPSISNIPLSTSVDKFSFPSGHATRVVLLTILFSSVSESIVVAILLSGWAVAICGSRVLLRRHHVLDVACGIVIGFIEWLAVAYLWVGEEKATWIASFVAGAEDEFDGS